MTQMIELERLRRYKGISQKEVADEIGVSERSYIYKVNGKSQFKLNEMFIISKMFEMPIDKIFLSKDFM